MTNEQLYIAVGLPIFAIITSLILSMFQLSGAREEFRTGLHEIREDIREIRADIKLLTGKVYEMMGQK